MAVEARKDVIINDLLCYTVNKFGKVACRPLKSTITDFYKSDDVTLARELLIDSLESDSVISAKSQKMPRRRKDSVGRTATEVEDIISVITQLDEEKKIDKLPIFVSSNPDNMPTVKLTDGDLACVLNKLAKMEEELVALRSAVNLSVSVGHQIHVLASKAASDQHVSSMPGGTAQGASVAGARVRQTVGKGGSQVVNISGRPGNDAARAQAVLAVAARGAESPALMTARQESSVISSCSDGEAGWVRKRSKKQRQLDRKCSRPSASPGQTLGLSNDCEDNCDDSDDEDEIVVAPPASYAESILQASTQPSGVKTVNRPIRKKTLIGASTTSLIKASSNLQLSKSVFRVGNVDGHCSADDLQEYLRSLEVRVLTCFELPRSVRQPLENKAFRVCIVSTDKTKLLNDKNWSLGIVIRPWTFKEKPANSGVAVGSTNRPNGVIESASQKAGEVITNSNSQISSNSSVLCTYVDLNVNVSTDQPSGASSELNLENCGAMQF